MTEVRVGTIDILRKLAEFEAAPRIRSEVALLEALASGVADDDVAVATRSAAALHAVATIAVGGISAGRADNGPLVALDILLKLTRGEEVATNTTKLLRCCELILKICGLSDATFSQAVGMGGLQVLEDLMRTSDVLVQLNAMELLEQYMCASHVQVRYLFEGGLASWLIFLATGWTKDGTGAGGGGDPLLGANALRILSSMSTVAYQTTTSSGGGGGVGVGSAAGEAADGGMGAGQAAGEVLDASKDAPLWTVHDPDIMHQFLRAIVHYSDGGESSHLAAVDAVSKFAGGSETAMSLVIEDRPLLEAWLTLPSRPQQQAIILQSVAHALAPHLNGRFDAASGRSEQSRSELACTPEAGRSELNRRLFEALGTYNGKQTMDLAVKLLGKPIPEQRCAAFALLRATAVQGLWGLQTLLGFATFSSFMQNRRSEQDKICKEWKFAVIEAIMHSPCLQEVCDPGTQGSFSAMLQEGPFFMPAMTAEVDLEAM